MLPITAWTAKPSTLPTSPLRTLETLGESLMSFPV
jgi:hypothetical protein